MSAQQIKWRPMHEYPLTCSIIETAAQFADGAPIKKIVLVIGESSGILGESIRMYFDIMAENTACAGAVIDIETVKPMLRCEACGTFFERKPFSFECVCGGTGMPTEIGREFHIKHIEVER